MSTEKPNKIRSQIITALPSLWRFALQLTRDNHDAEDLVQRTCVRALEHSDSYQDKQTPSSWLFRIAQNIWKNDLRSKSIRERGFVKAEPTPFYPPTAVEHDNQTPDTYLELREVVDAVYTLPEAQRVVLILVAVNGFSYADAASILEIPIGTVMSRLARARLAIGNQFLANNNDKIVPLARTQSAQPQTVKPA